MAETKAEDEDDESFGDFTFASFPNQSLHTKTTTDDNDEWGDFVESPLGSELPTAPSHTQLSSLDNNNNDNQWIKPKGALPLSLFGEEEEESRVVVDASAGDVKVKHPFTDKSNDNLKPENGFDDIIANLYGPNKQMKPGNGFSSNSDVVNVNTNGSLLKSDLEGNGNSDSFANLYDQSLGIKSENGDTTNSSKFGWNSNGSSYNMQGLNSNGSGSNLHGLNANGSSSNLQGLNFNGSNSNLQGLNANGSSSNLRGLNGNGSSSNLQGLNFNGSNSNLQGLNANGSSSNLQGLNFNGSNSNLQGLNANGSSSNLQGLNANGSSSNLQGLNANGRNSIGSSSDMQYFNASGLSLNLQGWNFIGSSSNLQRLNSNGSSSNLQGLNGNGLSSNLQGWNSNGSSSNLQGLNYNGLNSNLQGLKANGSSSNLQSLNFNGSNSNLQGSNANGSSSNLQGLIANGSSSNLQGLNFNGSSSNLQGLNANGLSSDLQVLNFNGSSSNLQGLNSNGSSSNLKALNSSFNGLNLNSGSIGGNEGFEVARNLESKVGITAENGFSSNSNRLDSISNASNSNLRGLDWNFNGLNSNSGPIDGKEEIEDDDDDDDDGWEFKVAYSEAKVGDGNITTENSFTSNPTKLDVNSNASSSNLRGSNSNFNGLNSNSEFVSGNVKFDADDDEGWGFKDAYSESKIINGNDKGPVALELAGVELQSKWEIGRDMQVDQKEHELTTNSSGFGNGLGEPIDLFSDSNGVFSKPHEDTGFDFKSSKVAETDSLSDSYFQSDQNDIENRFDSHPPVQHAGSDESFGDFKAAFSETESKHDEEPDISNRSTSEVEVLVIDGKNQGNETRPETHKGPVPLSIFGDEELETNGSSSIQDDFTFKPASFHRNTQSQGSSLSVDDLFELYSQAEPVNSVDSLEKPTENGLDSTDGVLDSKLMDDGDDFEDGSWEFKVAVSPTITKDTPQSIATETNLNNYADFYCKLKDELCAVARYHLAGLKQAQSSAVLTGESEKVAALDEEIQEACEELHQENIIYEEPHSDDRQPRVISLKEFLEVLNEPKFQVLESEYDLSRRLSMAEKDFKSAVELIKHATTMLKILTLVSLEEQSTYVSTWSKMLSVCAQELKHGAWIWKQSLEKKVHNQIISEPQGKGFIIALGEIYRVVAILGASVKLYRPWILSSSSVDSTSICTLLEECHTLWSSSGLEETLPTISDPVGSEYFGTANVLAESIEQIQGLDAFALWNRVFAQQESVCRLSALTPGVVPDMKMVVWDGGNYFLTITNLWANLISCDPPKLPSLQFG